MKTPCSIYRMMQKWKVSRCQPETMDYFCDQQRQWRSYPFQGIQIMGSLSV
jgi:hypothetical protein